MAAGGRDDGAKPWHGPDGRFRNPPGSPGRGGDRRAWAAFSWRRFREGHRPPPGLPTDLLVPSAEARREVEALATGGGEGITWLGHSCFLLRLAGRWLLTDPFLGDVASPYAWLGPYRHTPPALRAGELPPIDAVLLSHAHFDHLDLPTLAAITGRERAVLIAPLGVGRYLGGLGYARLVELDWYERTGLGDLAVTALPAIHFSRRTASDRNRALWCGFLVGNGRQHLYFAGDTAYGPVFREIGARCPAPDLALVPIGAYEPQELMRGSHCTPEDAVAIGRDLGAKALCAMHWGAIKLTDEPPLEPIGRFRQAAERAGYGPHRALLLKVGETRRLPV